MNFNVRHRLLRLEHAVGPVSEAETEPPLTNEQIGELLRQYHADPSALSDMDRQRCAGIVYLTDPTSSGYRPAFRAAFGLEGGSAA